MLDALGTMVYCALHHMLHRHKEEARRLEEKAIQDAEAQNAQQRREAHAAACHMEEERINNLINKKEVLPAFFQINAWKNVC